MNELRLGIETDSPAVERNSSVAQDGRRNPRYSDIDRLPFHVQAMRGDARSSGPQEFVAPGCAITADDINFRSCPANQVGQIVEKVKQPFVQLTHVAGTMIAKKLVQAIHCLRHILISSSIHNVDPLVGMGMVKPQAIFWQRRFRGIRRYRLQHTKNEQERQKQQ